MSSWLLCELAAIMNVRDKSVNTSALLTSEHNISLNSKQISRLHDKQIQHLMNRDVEHISSGELKPIEWWRG